VARAARLGSGPADAGGAFGGPLGSGAELALDRVDRPVVYLVAVDPAGNSSDADGDPDNGIQAVAVRDVEWTATLGYKVPGSRLENPHLLETRSWFTGRWYQGDAREAETPSAGATRGDGEAAVTRGEGTWRARALGADAPEGRDLPGAAYDLARERMVLFGGQARSGAKVGDTWEWDGTSWSLREPLDPEEDGDPAPRVRGALAYDARRERTVLFSGSGADGPDDTWEWAGWSWTRRRPEDPEEDGDPPQAGGEALPDAAVVRA